MAVVISNRGRLISDLTSVANLNNDDLFIIQSVNASTNSTRKATISLLSQKVLGSLSSYSTTVKFSSTGNEFTGAFYNANGNTSNLYDVTIRNSLSIGTGVTATISPTNLTFSPVNGALFTKKITNTIGGITGSASTGFTGSLKGKLTGPVTGSVRGNVVGNLTGNVTGNVTGTLAGNVTGNVSGNVTGDIYSPISILVLDNGTGLAKSARFYGTSSYSTQALTAAYASSGAGGVPVGGNQYQVLTKDGSGGDIWSTPITRSGAPTANYVSYWTDNKTLAASSVTFYSGTDTLQTTNLSVTGKITGNAGITGSFYGVGFKTLNSKSVSFWGTGSHAVSASYAANLNTTFVSTLSSIPSAGNTLTQAHGLAGVPKTVRWVFVNTSGGALRGVANNGEVDASATWWGVGGSNEEAWGVNTIFWADNTNCYISSYQTLLGPYLRIASDTAKFDPATALTSPDWKLKCYATY